MRFGPSDVLLRLEPSAHVLNRETNDVRTVAAVELYWKPGRNWKSKTFLHNDGSDGLGAILRDLADWLDACPSLDAALSELD
jgi:hypothetical protein